MNKLCIIGDIVVDVTLKNNDTPLKMRLGGIVHCARALWAMNIEYSIAYFAPKYLTRHIKEYLDKFGKPEIIYLGEVETSPYVMLINEVKEIGNQGYDFLLRDDIKIKYNINCLPQLAKFSEVLIISGNYNHKKILNALSNDCIVNIDFANNIDKLSIIKKDSKYGTIFISTSSNYFLDYYKKKKLFNIKNFFNDFKNYTNRIVLKENRGGSRAFDFSLNQLINISSQTQPIIHSVGVGDVYNTVCVTKLIRKSTFEESLNFASWIATEYALTTYPEDFKKMVERILNTPIIDIIELKGVKLPWEARKKINIYIAAPDFDFVDTRPIDLLVEKLNYHNFSTRRPIMENGQMGKDATEKNKRELFHKDMQLLSKCQILIAVLIYNDPGTLIEIGLAAEKGIPTLVYDPNNIASNCMLTQLPDIVSSDLDVILSETFSRAKI